MHLRRDASFLKSSPARAPALLALAIGALGAMAASDARADEKEVCVRAVDRAQLARLDGKLREARGGLMICARAACPGAIREDCTRWLAEVEESLPSAVFEAVWADGRDVTGMKVFLDGEPLAGAEAGRAVSLDPGAHSFRFEVAGAAPVETRNVIREGEKNRILHVTFGATAPPAGAVLAPPPSVPETAAPVTPVPAAMWHDLKPEEGRRSSRAPVPAAAYALGGGALLGFGGFAYLGLTGTGQLDSMRSTCGHSCNPSDVTSARNEILAGDILAFVALAATGVAALLVLTRPHVVTTELAR